MKRLLTFLLLVLLLELELLELELELEPELLSPEAVAAALSSFLPRALAMLVVSVQHLGQRL